jgi:hypothetical protein
MDGQPHYPTDDDAAAVLKQCAVHAGCAEAAEAAEAAETAEAPEAPEAAGTAERGTAKGNARLRGAGSGRLEARQQPCRERRTGRGRPWQACDLEQWIGRREAEAGSSHDLQQGAAASSGPPSNHLSLPRRRAAGGEQCSARGLRGRS